MPTQSYVLCQFTLLFLLSSHEIHSLCMQRTTRYTTVTPKKIPPKMQVKSGIPQHVTNPNRPSTFHSCSSLPFPSRRIHTLPLGTVAQSNYPTGTHTHHLLRTSLLHIDRFAFLNTEACSHFGPGTHAAIHPSTISWKGMFNFRSAMEWKRKETQGQPPPQPGQHGEKEEGEYRDWWWASCEVEIEKRVVQIPRDW